MDQQHLLRERRKEWKRARRIKKAEKMATMPKTSKQEDGFVCPRRSIANKRHDLRRASSFQRAQISWQEGLRGWIETNEKSLQGCIQSTKAQLPTLKSIDELFSLASREMLSTDSESESLARYSKVCSLLNYSQGKVVLLRQEGTGAVGVSVDQKVQNYPFAFGMTLSESQVRMAEKRSIFMEKLKTNEAKYDNSLGRMSQISKELAFTYRVYLQQRSQVLCYLQSLKGKVAAQSAIKSYAATRYSRLLIRKNLRHTFESMDLDCLNYFKMREHVEADRVHEFRNITSFEQLATFILKRKPKRGRKLALPTACSVCLSDYYQLSNPLRPCSLCGLRAHELCYSFQSHRCGYCAYQKMQRQLKEIVSWCVICRKPGLMVVKLDQCHYAHGFCLLVHGLWSCDGKGTSDKTSFSLREAEFLQPSKETLWSKNTKVIEYSNPLYDNNLKPNNLSGFQTNPHAILQHQLHDKIQSSDHPEIEDLRPFQSRNGQNNLSFHEFQEKISRCKQKRQGCQHCRQPFLKDYFVTCQLCGHQYHALCAFLSGCKMTLEEGKPEESENLPKVICCEGESSKIGWNRRFKLNYNRCVFGLVPQDVEQRQSASFWEE